MDAEALNFTNVEQAWIFATDGSLMATLNHPTSFKVASLAPGVYLVKMQNKNIIRTQKVTIR